MDSRILLCNCMNCELLWHPDMPVEIQGCYASDLLSDVVANAREADMLITIQAHLNTMAVSSVVGLRAVVIANNRPVANDLVEAAKEKEIILAKSRMNQYNLSGMAYCALNGKD